MIDILVKVQYPISQDKDVDVDLLESSAAANNEETGIFTCKLKLAPGEVKSSGSVTVLSTLKIKC